MLIWDKFQDKVSKTGFCYLECEEYIFFLIVNSHVEGSASKIVLETEKNVEFMSLQI